MNEMWYIRSLAVTSCTSLGPRTQEIEGQRILNQASNTIIALQLVLSANFVMPELLSQLTGSQWTNDGPQTPAQRFFAKYAATVDSYGFTQGSGSRFYAKDVLFHNQNNAEVSCTHFI